MAFDRSHFQKITSSLNNIEPRGWSYSSTTDSKGNIETSGYFNPVIEEINSGDFVYVRATDDVRFYEFTVTGSTVTISNSIDISMSYSLHYATNSAGTSENFYMSIYPLLRGRLATILVTDAITGDTVISFELKARNTGGFLVPLGTMTFNSTGGYPQRQSVAFSPEFIFNPYFEVYFEKVNTGTPQAVNFVASIDGITPQ